MRIVNIFVYENKFYLSTQLTSNTPKLGSTFELEENIYVVLLVKFKKIIIIISGRQNISDENANKNEN